MTYPVFELADAFLDGLIEDQVLPVERRRDAARRETGAEGGGLRDAQGEALDPLIGLSSSVASFAVTKERAPARQAFDGTFKGRWTDVKGTSLEIRMTLQRQQHIVRGKYEFGLGSAELEGIVTGDQLDFAWRWGSDYFGRGRLRANKEGGLEGTWGYTQSSEGDGSLSVTSIP